MKKLVVFFAFLFPLLIAPIAQGHSTTEGNESYYFCKRSKTSHRHVHHATPSKRHQRRHKCHVHRRNVEEEGHEYPEYPPAPTPPSPPPVPAPDPPKPDDDFDWDHWDDD